MQGRRDGHGPSSSSPSSPSSSSSISCRGGGMVLGIGSKSSALGGEGAGCQGGIAGRPLARIYGVLLK